MGAPAIQAPGERIGRHDVASRRGKRLLRRASAKLDVKKTLDARLSGLTLAEIARAAGVSESAVSQTLKPFKPLIEAQLAGVPLIVAGEREDSLLDAARGLILQNMANPAVVAAADLRSCALAYDKLHIAKRLRAGESTANNALSVVVQGALDRVLTKRKVDSSPDRCESADRTDEVAVDATQAAIPAPQLDAPGASSRFGGGGGNAAPSGASAPSRSKLVAGAALSAYQQAVAGALRSPRRKSGKPRGKLKPSKTAPRRRKR